MERPPAVVLYLIALSVVPQISAGQGAAPNWPAEWVSGWKATPVDCRPLQIVHGLTPQQVTPEILARTIAAGLGGFVCNVSFDGYLMSEGHWFELAQAL